MQCRKLRPRGRTQSQNLGNDYVWICLGIWGTIGSRCVAGPAGACHTHVLEVFTR